LNSLNTEGYKETLKYLNGKFSEEETIEEIKKNTRRYAKRQMTWFRKNSEIDWLAGNDNPKLTTENILEKLSVSA
jgi:tRNA dimethylallyltransferase